MIVEYCEAWFHHGSVVVAVEFVKVGLLVPHEFHHASQVLIFVVTSVEFKLAVATDEDEWWAIFANPVERCILVDGGLQCWYALHLAHVVVCNGLSAKRHTHHYAVGIDVVACQPCLVEAKQHVEVSAC